MAEQKVVRTMRSCTVQSLGLIVYYQCFISMSITQLHKVPVALLELQPRICVTGWNLHSSFGGQGIIGDWTHATTILPSQTTLPKRSRKPISNGCIQILSSLNDSVPFCPTFHVNCTGAHVWFPLSLDLKRAWPMLIATLTIQDLGSESRNTSIFWCPTIH